MEGINSEDGKEEGRRRWCEAEQEIASGGGVEGRLRRKREERLKGTREKIWKSEG